MSEVINAGRHEGTCTKGNILTTEDVELAKYSKGTMITKSGCKVVIFVSLCVSFTLISAAISAYNAGAKNIWTYDGIDTGTTHNDYANDVVARATFFKRNGY